MTRDQFRLPKLPFIFHFKINEHWQEAYDSFRNDTDFSKELSDIEEDLKTIIQSVSIIFPDCSAKKLCFLSKAYMIFVHFLDTSDWDHFESVDGKIDYLKQCFNAYHNKDENQLKELSPFFYKLIKLFENYEKEQNQAIYSTIDDQYSADSLIKSLINSLNDIMLKVEDDHEELNCSSTDTLNIEEKANSYLSHNVNHYDVILAKLFFNEKMISEEIENDRNYKELKHCMSKVIGLINDIYSFPMEYHQYQQHDQVNFIIKLVEWFKISISQALSLVPDYVDELLQSFDQLSKKLLETHQHNSTQIRNYIEFWKKMYVAAVLFCTQTPRYSKFFIQPINYEFLKKFNNK